MVYKANTNHNKIRATELTEYIKNFWKNECYQKKESKILILKRLIHYIHVITLNLIASNNRA